MEKVKQSGQALTEYIILLAILVSLFSSMMALLSKSTGFANLKKTFTEQYVRAYRYGHPEARGQDDGGPVNIPQVSSKENQEQNFRIFINPSKQ